MVPSYSMFPILIENCTPGLRATSTVPMGGVLVTVVLVDVVVVLVVFVVVRVVVVVVLVVVETLV